MVTSRIRQLVIVAVLGVVLSMVLVVFGLPESTAAQSLALELSALPLSLSLAAGDLILLERAGRTPTPRARSMLILGGAISGLGLMLMALSYVTSAPSLVQFGQFVVFVGLGTVLLVAVGLQGSGTTEWFHLEEVAEIEGDEADEEPASVEAADPRPGASL